ncbi:MAG: hypothetical protein AB8B66_05950 [Rickettsiaceae bacterium]
MQNTIKKLYSFIARLVVMLEEELDELKVSRSRSAVSIKKNITDTLNKLVTLIIQLNKLSKDTVITNVDVVTTEDQEIIARFVKKYNK